MTGLALTAPAAVGRTIVAELLERQRLLALYGIGSIVLGLLVVAMIPADPRTLQGVSVWVKPAKFLFSTAAFALTAAWYYGYVRPERRRSRALRWSAWTLVAASAFEIAWISWQASQGLASHFNHSSPFYSTMYGLMGIAALALIGTTLPLAWEIARRPAQGLRADFAAAVAIGLVLTFLLGTTLGFYMAGGTGHTVGAAGGHFPVFGWNRLGGDLRVAHFFGIHAEQAIPLLAFLAAGLGARMRWAVLAAGTALYVAVTLGVFFQAVAGRPFLAF
ncbi:MAG TPA: hypothetical protein VF552_06415 [Allosphingosinicella sp.]|jgi:uncharacterized protein YjeT (DUF2065 family)